MNVTEYDDQNRNDPELTVREFCSWRKIFLGDGWNCWPAKWLSSMEEIPSERTLDGHQTDPQRVQKKKVVIPKKNPARPVAPLRRQRIANCVPGPPPGPPPKRMRPSASSIPSRKWHDLLALSKPTILSHMYILWPNVTYTSKTMYNCFFLKKLWQFLKFLFSAISSGGTVVLW